MELLKKYRHLTYFIVGLIVAYIVFYDWERLGIHEIFLSLGRFGFFLTGMLYAYGFSAPSATVILLELAKEESFHIILFYASMGALFSDMIIFMLVKKFLHEDLIELSKTKIYRFIEKEERLIFGKFKKYISLIIGGIFVASPLPTEIGIGMIASIKDMELPAFSFLALMLHILGIGVILLIAGAA